MRRRTSNGILAHITGLPSTMDGRSGKALEFSGLDDFVEVYRDPKLDLLGPLTLDAWVKHARPFTDFTIIAKGNQYGLTTARTARRWVFGARRWKRNTCLMTGRRAMATTDTRWALLTDGLSGLLVAGAQDVSVSRYDELDRAEYGFQRQRNAGWTTLHASAMVTGVGDTPNPVRPRFQVRPDQTHTSSLTLRPLTVAEAVRGIPIGG